MGKEWGKWGKGQGLGNRVEMGLWEVFEGMEEWIGLDMSDGEMGEWVLFSDGRISLRNSVCGGMGSKLTG